MGAYVPIHYPSALSRAFGEAPYFPRCSYNKTAVFSRPRHLAFDYPYMQVNRKDLRSWLVFDLDHAGDWLWESEQFPAPNLIVRDPKSGSSHWFYAIEPVRTGPDSRPAPQRFMKSVYRAMRSRIGADIDYAGGPVAKTPGHPQWETLELHSHIYSLGELADFPFFDDYQSQQPPPWSNKDCDTLDQDRSQLESRHVSLFLSLQRIAFSAVWSFRCQGPRAFPRFYDHLLSQAHGLNRFSTMGYAKGNLPTSSLKSTVKSVSRWVWDNYYASSRPNTGIMNLDPSLPQKERQRLSALRTHALRANATKQRIGTAVRSLYSQGSKISFSAIARESGLCRQTVSKYRDAITTALSTLDQPSESTPDLATRSDQQRKTELVNFGAHQVTTNWALLTAEGFSWLTQGFSDGEDETLSTVIFPKCRSGPDR